MGAGEVAVRIREYLVESKGLTPAEAPDLQLSLLQAGLVDSLGMMDLVAFLEETFGIAVEDDDLVPENFETIAAMAGFVRRKRDGIA